MKLAELTQYINWLSELDEYLLSLIIAGTIFARFLFKKFKGDHNTQSSLQLQDSDKNIKFKGPATIATLIILLNYFRQNNKYKL